MPSLSVAFVEPQVNKSSTSKKYSAARLSMLDSGTISKLELELLKADFATLAKEKGESMRIEAEKTAKSALVRRFKDLGFKLEFKE
jgi:hypothetical protein